MFTSDCWSSSRATLLLGSFSHNPGSGLAGVTQVDAIGPAGAPVAATNLRVVNDGQVTCTFNLSTGKWTVRVRSGSLAPVPATPEIEVT